MKKLDSIHVTGGKPLSLHFVLLVIEKDISHHRINWLILNLPLFGNDFTRSVKIFGVANISLSQIENGEKNFLVLVEWPKGDITESIGTAWKNFRVNLNKAKRKFC